MSAPVEHNTEHVAQGIALTIHDQRKPKLNALLASYLSEVQALEDALYHVYVHSMIRDAFGQALDRLGALVTQPRENRTDDVYRTWILARALVLRSSGRIPELLAIGRMVVPASVQLVIEEEYPAALTLTLEGLVDAALGRAVAQLLIQARARGVRMFVRWQTVTPAFRYAASSTDELDSPTGYGAGGYASALLGAHA